MYRRFSTASNFVDFWSMHLQAGKGGKGGCAFFRSTFNPRGKPCGGDGGRGGNIWIEVDGGMDNLMGLEKQCRAGNGGAGSRNRQEGARGEDRTIKVPMGTDIKEEDGHLLFTGDDPKPFLICRGGKGGRGNYALGLNNHEFEGGETGEEKRISLNLMTIADIGLVGMPNAGKSSLLAALTRANPKIAAYPFTTLVPRKGILDYPLTGEQLSICDIPGLIEGAHRNIGLGHSFLKHIVKSRLIAYVIDASRQAPWDDVAILDHELERYRTGLVRKRILVIANKVDLGTETLSELQRRLGDHVQVVPISAKHGHGLEHLKHKLKQLL